jgi:ABC-type multidrug transport system ATPase subunit/ABC-type multidrug transport system permease subunit
MTNEIVVANDESKDGSSATLGAAPAPAAAAPKPAPAGTTGLVPLDVDVDPEAGPENRMSMIRSPSRVKNQDIRWSGLNFNIKGKDILQDCWGYVPNRKLFGILGPSGSGKSSLLNVLSGRSSSSAADGITVKGHIEVAGMKIDPVKFRKNIAYVMQEDALMATATPREALRFSALLRLPADTDAATIENIVNHLLGELGIKDCADTIIGNVLIKGISGGQKKRTSVGVEMITDPSLLFLDEPTSGLDSFAAYNLVELLRDVARAGAAVVCTIHQPSSEVFHLFDLVMFLRAGRIIYSGPAAEISEYFAQRGRACPEHYNPADFVMMLLQTDTEEQLQKFAPAVPEYALAPKESANKSQLTVFSEKSGFETRASFFRQLFYLVERELQSTFRNVGALIGRFGITIFLNLIFGLIFLGAGGRDNANSSDFGSHFGALTMVTISSMFGSAQPALLNFPFERPLFLREYSTGTYGAPAYFISKTAVELPIIFAQTVTQYALVHNMCEFQGSFILMVLSAWGVGVAAASLGVLMGCLVTDVKNAVEISPLLLVPQILFAGFFIKMDLIPVFLRWAQYLCSLKYGMNLLILLEFHPDQSSCEGPGAEENCRMVLSENDVVINQWWVYMLILVALFVGFRVLGAIALARRAKKFY